jgi:hypothetical protein
MVNIGLQIHAKMTGANGQGTRDYSAEEKTYLDRLIVDLNASAYLVLDEHGWCTRFRDMAKNSLFVFRKYHDREGDFWNVTTPENLLNAYKVYSGERIVINIGNESLANEKITDGELQRQARFYATCMELFGKANIPIAVPGWGTGQPDVERLSQLKPMWDAFQAYPLHYLSIHEYFSYRGLEVGNGRIGRHATIAGWLSVHDYRVPNMLITEYGCDQIDDTGKRGWKSSYGGNEDKYADVLIEGKNTAYSAPHIKGLMTYSHGDSNGWPDFDTSQAKQLHQRLIVANKVVSVPPPTPTPAPTPPPPPAPTLPRNVQIAIANTRVFLSNTVADLKSERRFADAEISALETMLETKKQRVKDIDGELKAIEALTNELSALK